VYIHDRHEPLARKILAAVGLGMPSVAGFEKVGKATVFFADDGKPIYGFNVEGGLGEMLLSRRFSAEDLASTRQLASRIVRDTSLDSVIRLLNDSLEVNQEKLRKFLFAWMALEVFVNKNFGAYQEKFGDGLSAEVSQPVRERYFKRIHEVVGNKYKQLDKFVIISAELDPREADHDITIFQRSKKLRDEISHGETVDEKALPVAEIQRLVRKFLRLHVSSP
jgi:hypothetical protein